MRRIFWSLLCFVALVSTIVANEESTTAPELRIEYATGIGSGVHIGDRRVLTAAHIAANMADGPGTVIDENGNKARAYVVWTDEKNDIAMLRMLDPMLVRSALYSCVDPAIGTEIEAVGNPLKIPFVHTWGRIASKRINEGPWAAAIVVDLTINGGMSGGPVYDNAGTVVGLVIGASIEGPHRVNFIVPTAVACDRLNTPVT